MCRPCWIFVLIFVSSPVDSVVAQVDKDAAALADRYLAAMQHKGYAFLSKDELLHRRDQIAAFTVKHLREPLNEARRAAMLAGIDRCIDRLYRNPAGKVSYDNGFGSGGEEWMYLNDPDYFLTFQYHLWVGLTSQQPSPAQSRQRDTQRQWMRKYLTDLPFRGNDDTPPREGMRMRREEVRQWVLDELDRSFADPLDLLSETMPDDGFAKLQDRFKEFSNGLVADLHDMRVAALTSRFPWRKDPAGRHGYTYSGILLPFDDKVVTLWGNGPSLHFASNAGFRGDYGGVGTSVVYDVVRCAEMRLPAGATLGAWLAREGRGDLMLAGSSLIAVRGAKIAKVAVKNWFEADKLSDDQLRALIREGDEPISMKGLPSMKGVGNGPRKGDRSEGEFFIVVQTHENRLAVINLYGFAELWCRPRPPTAPTDTVPATKPSSQAGRACLPDIEYAATHGVGQAGPTYRLTGLRPRGLSRE